MMVSVHAMETQLLLIEPSLHGLPDHSLLKQRYQVYKPHALFNTPLEKSYKYLNNQLKLMYTTGECDTSSKLDCQSLHEQLVRVNKREKKNKKAIARILGGQSPEMWAREYLLFNAYLEYLFGRYNNTFKKIM